MVKRNALRHIHERGEASTFRALAMGHFHRSIAGAGETGRSDDYDWIYEPIPDARFAAFLAEFHFELDAYVRTLPFPRRFHWYPYDHTDRSVRYYWYPSQYGHGPSLQCWRFFHDMAHEHRMYAHVTFKGLVCNRDTNKKRPR